MSWYLGKGQDWDVVISSRIRLARNLSNQAFPHKLKTAQRIALREEILAALRDYERQSGRKFIALNMELLPEPDRIALMEKHLVSEDMTKGEAGQSLCISEDESESMLINEEDHLRIQVMAAGFSLEDIYQKAETLAIALEQRLPIAYSEHYGFLTACPSNVGTGMRASVMVHLPLLTQSGKMRDLVEGLGQAGFTVRGYLGERSQAEGNVYQLSNQITLGISEEDILKGFQRMVREVMTMERNLRQQWYENSPELVEDRVYRSYGELKFAKIMPEGEARRRISDLRLGIALGFFKEHDESQMAQLSAAVGAASIQKLLGQEVSESQQGIERATVIRDLLAPIKVKKTGTSRKKKTEE